MTPGLPAPLVLTGASGFIGRRLLHRLATEAASSPLPRPVTLLVRGASLPAGIEPIPAAWRVVTWDLGRGDAPPEGAIPPGSVVVHLAAATGRSAPAEMRSTNIGGTERLALAAAAAGARHFLFVSSIAAGFTNRRWYPYAETKRAAERSLRHRGVPVTIVRPTMVFGPGSPVQEGLERLATGRAPIVPGRGTVRVQPVHVDDLAAALLTLADMPPDGDRVLEVGGNERPTIRELLARIRAARGLAPRDPWSVPLGLPRLGLAIAEQVPGLQLPVTAGQFASFLNDSIAEPNAALQRILPTPRGISEMLGTAPASAPHPGGVTGHEFLVFARYLGTEQPGPAATAAYLRGETGAARAVGDRLDGVLLRMARRSVAWCGLADAYARLVRPYGPLRRRLVLTLAVLESTPGVHMAYDTALPSTAPIAWLALGAHGARWILRSVAAILAFAPVHLALRLSSRGVVRG